MLRYGLTVSGALALLASWAIPAAAAPRAAPAQRAAPTFTAQQASAGKQAYAAQCASCHGRTLSGSEFAGALNGNQFSQDWGGKTAEALFTFVRTRMPPTKPNSLTPEAAADVVAYLIEVNGWASGAACCGGRAGRNASPAQSRRALAGHDAALTPFAAGAARGACESARRHHARNRGNAAEPAGERVARLAAHLR
jgi:mono/diheme cytochrome c family protein